MPKFGTRSTAQLATVHRKLRTICEIAIRIVDFSVLEGHRSAEEQERVYNLGLSKVLKGKHNEKPSLAVDLAPYPVDWEDKRRFYLLAGVMLTVAWFMRTKLRWGGDWDGDGDLNDQTFNDLGHFEIEEQI